MSDAVVIVFDDERSFHEEAEKLYAALVGRVLYARSTPEMMQLWNQIMCPPIVRCAELWLDHDLGANDTTRQFVSQLEADAHAGIIYPIDQIFIHSANPSATWLYAALIRHYPVQCVNAKDRGLIK